MAGEVASHERQLPGLAAVVTLAGELPIVSSAGEAPDTRDQRRTVHEGSKWSVIGVLAGRLRRDHMMRDSLYLVSSSGLQAGFGFSFWIITAHLFDAADVGEGSALTSAATVIAYLALMGLNSGLGRYLPTARGRNTMISATLALVAVSGGSFALCYIYVTPFIAPRLSFIARNPELAVGFAILTAAAALNILTDSVFVASRKAGYTAFVDGIVAGFGKIILAVALAGTGAYGLFAASAVGTALAAVASLGLIYTALHCHFSMKDAVQILRPLLRFSTVNYVGNVLNMLPMLVVPVIVLDRLGASAAAYYFVVYQVVSILYAAARAIEQTFLAEGSREEVNMRRLIRRSLRILVMLCLPAIVTLIAVARWILLAFGTSYYRNGFQSFLVMVIAAVPVTAIYWLLTVLRLFDRLRSIVIVNAIYAVAVCALAWVGASHGLTAVALAWLTGALLAAMVASASLPREISPWRRSFGKEPNPEGDSRRVGRRVGGGTHRGHRRRTESGAVVPDLQERTMGVGLPVFTVTADECESESMIPPTQHRKPSWRWWLSGFVFIVLLITGVTAYSPYVRHEWALSLGRRDRSFTELSFNDAADLPTADVQGTAMRISFIITNHGNTAAAYRYVISSGNNARLKPLRSAVAVVEPGEKRTVSDFVVPDCSPGICRVNVSLPQQREEIDVILAVKPKGTAMRL